MDYWLVALGAIFGTFKSISLNTKVSAGVKFINALTGLFVGVLTGLHFLTQTSSFLAGLSSLLGASLAVAIIDAIYRITPDLVEGAFESYLNIKRDKDDSS